MEKNDEIVKIIEICKVPPLPSPCEPKLLPLTFFDIILLSFPSTSRLYFYQNPNPNNVLPNLKHSLSLILPHYLPLVGNLTWPHHSHKPIIQFLQNDAVSLTVAESNLDFHHLTRAEFRLQSNYHPLVPQLPTADNRIAAMALQVTIFPNEGFSIGITTHHVVVDGNTSTSFMKSWAHVCNDISNLNLNIQPCYDRRAILNDTAHLEPTSLNRSLKLPPFEPNPDSYRTTLELTRQDLGKLKQWALNNNQNRSFDHISSFTLTLAYVLHCRAKLEGLTNGKMQWFFAVDARSRLQPPLPSNYFGNCLISGCVVVDRNEVLGENGILVAIEEISKAIRSLEGGILKWLEKKGLQSKDEHSKDEHSMEHNYSVASSPKFGVYSANFGWGKPVKVEFLTISRETFALSDRKNGDGGIEIGLIGERNELERMASLFTQGLQGL